MVQPNSSRAHTFAESFIASGGIEALLVLLQREAKAGDCIISESPLTSDKSLPAQGSVQESGSGDTEKCQDDEAGYVEQKKRSSKEKVGESQPPDRGSNHDVLPIVNIERMTSPELSFDKNLGGINLSISADNARNNVYNIDKSDGIVVGIIRLSGALVASGHLKSDLHPPPDATSTILGTGLDDGGSTMFDDKVSLLLFALHKAFHAAPNRLMTSNVYVALLGASV